MKAWDKCIVEAVSHALNSFAENELAYLALTSKIEHSIRDRMAFHLHSLYESEGYLIAREWKRVDLAVISSEGSPVCLLELKAIYTFDALKVIPWFVKNVISDLDKITQYELPKENIFALIIETQIHGSVSPNLSQIVKYSSKINGAYQRDRETHSIRQRVSTAMREMFRDRVMVAHEGETPGGKAFGLEATIHYWLVRPV